MSFFKKTAPPIVIPEPKSVASITAGLSDTLAELEAHAADQTSQASYQVAVAERAMAAVQEHTAESDLALKVAGNIRNLLGA